MAFLRLAVYLVRNGPQHCEVSFIAGTSRIAIRLAVLG